MKLVLANNHSDKFVQFHADVQAGEKTYDYASYRSLLFYFDKDEAQARDVTTDTPVTYYDGVYINGYLATVETAYALATVLDHVGIPYVNKELSGAPSQTKLTAYAKLAAAGIDVPRTFAGSPFALLEAVRSNQLDSLGLPLVLKRADADRGIDNFLLESYEAIVAVLLAADESSIWLAQEFIPNDGFYLVSLSHGAINYGVFRKLGVREDNDKKLAHMFKPFGGKNATMLAPDALPAALKDAATRAADAMNRQIATVDCLYDEATQRVFVLEVNYNPQIVTSATFAAQKKKAFIEAIRSIE